MITIYLPQDIEAQIQQNALARAVSIVTCLEMLIRIGLRPETPSVIPAQASKDEFMAWWTEWTQKSLRHLQANENDMLNESCFRRGDIYDDDGR